MFDVAESPGPAAPASANAPGHDHPSGHQSSCLPFGELAQGLRLRLSTGTPAPGALRAPASRRFLPEAWSIVPCDAVLGRARPAHPIQPRLRPATADREVHRPVLAELQVGHRQALALHELLHLRAARRAGEVIRRRQRVLRGVARALGLQVHREDAPEGPVHDEERAPVFLGKVRLRAELHARRAAEADIHCRRAASRDRTRAISPCLRGSHIRRRAPRGARAWGDTTAGPRPTPCRCRR